jgi:hypothetical protein
MQRLTIPGPNLVQGSGCGSGVPKLRLCTRTNAYTRSCLAGPGAAGPGVVHFTGYKRIIVSQGAVLVYAVHTGQLTSVVIL